MNHLHVGRRTYAVPGQFTELSPRQLLAVVGLLHAGHPRLDLRLHLVLALLDVARRPGLYVQLHRLSDEQRHSLLALADFCLEEPRFTRQLLPVLRVPGAWRRWWGPGDAFSTLTFGEFIQAEGHFAAYRGPADVAALDALVATLYRPAGRGAAGADRRCAFEAAEVASRVPAAGRLPLAVRLAVRLWYASCRAAWARKYADTLFAPGDEPAPARSGRPREAPQQTWRRILAERAGSPLHYDAYGSLLLPNVFFDLDQRIRRHRDELAAHEAAR